MSNYTLINIYHIIVWNRKGHILGINSCLCLSTLKWKSLYTVDKGKRNALAYRRKSCVFNKRGYMYAEFHLIVCFFSISKMSHALYNNMSCLLLHCMLYKLILFCRLKQQTTCFTVENTSTTRDNTSKRTVWKADSHRTNSNWLQST